MIRNKIRQIRFMKELTKVFAGGFRLACSAYHTGLRYNAIYFDVALKLTKRIRGINTERAPIEPAISWMSILRAYGCVLNLMILRARFSSPFVKFFA